MCLFAVVSILLFYCQSNQSFAKGLSLCLCLSLSIMVFGAPCLSHFGIVSKVLLLRVFFGKIILPFVLNSRSELFTSLTICSEHLAVEAALAPRAAHLNLLVGRRMSARFNKLLLSPPVSTKTCCLEVFTNDRHELTAKTTSPTKSIISQFGAIGDSCVL